MTDLRFPNLPGGIAEFLAIDGICTYGSGVLKINAITWDGAEFNIVQEELAYDDTGGGTFTRQIPLQNRQILNLSVVKVDDSYLSGNVAVKCYLTSSGANYTDYQFVLIAGFPGYKTPLTWPATSAGNITRPHSARQVISTGDQTVQQEDWTQSNAGFMLLHGIAFKLVTSATVGNRHMLVNILDGSGDITFRAYPATDVPASTSRYHLFRPCFGDEKEIQDCVHFPFPPVVLRPDFKIRTRIQGFKAGDVLHDRQFEVEVFPDM
jgi:hypothetical protein